MSTLSDPSSAVRPAPLAEFVGTGVLAMVVTSSTFALAYYGQPAPGMQWLLAGAGAAAVVVVFGLLLPGVRLHPLVTLLDLRAGRVTVGAGAASILAQFLGGAVGNVLGFWTVLGVGGIEVSTAGMTGAQVSDVLYAGAVAGLVIGLAVGLAARRRPDLLVPVIALASFAAAISADKLALGNPALVLGRIVGSTEVLTGLSPEQALLTIAGHLIGFVVALLLLPVLDRD
ncbi:hypothetical protein GCM10022215_26500 [Nocardioides fonticola]|uniref:Aquaporin family protein n=1 Tax=Nocardioides fonticola TaxID=450363 RepID=A0ABP7XLE2_9ACTN